MIGRSDENIPGYTLVPNLIFSSHEQATIEADRMNLKGGLSKKEAWEIICSTMRPMTRKEKEDDEDD